MGGLLAEAEAEDGLAPMLPGLTLPLGTGESVELARNDDGLEDWAVLRLTRRSEERRLELLLELLSSSALLALRGRRVGQLLSEGSDTSCFSTSVAEALLCARAWWCGDTGGVSVRETDLIISGEDRERSLLEAADQCPSLSA
jgi:hypothetical protein